MIRHALLTIVLCCSTSAGADTLDAHDQLLRAAELLSAAESAGDRVAALTGAVRAYEAGLAATRTELRRLTLEERQLETALAAEDADITSLLVLMQNATEQTETESLLHPGSAVDTIRAGTLAQALLPDLAERADALMDRLATLDDMRTVINASKTRMRDGLAGVQSARLALADALRNRTDLPPRLATNDAAMEALINSADTVSALASSLAHANGGAAQSDSTPWIAPVTGTLLAEYAPDAGRAGWSVSTESRAVLTSPMDATIRFSDEFPDRGTVVMLEGDDQHLLVLAGLSASFVALGQVVAAGEPIGFAGAWQSAAQDNLNVRGADVSLSGEETVYIELRQGGAPVDPATRLTLEQEQG